MQHNKTPAKAGVFVLADHVGQKAHEAAALDRVGQLTLVPGTDAGALARNDLAEGREITLKRLRILVVDFTDIGLAEETGLRLAVGFHHRWWGAERVESSGTARGE